MTLVASPSGNSQSSIVNRQSGEAVTCSYRGHTWARFFCVHRHDRTDIRRLWDPRAIIPNGQSSIVNCKSITCGSFFSGYGGADHGLSLAGLEHIWLCEINNDCQRVLEYWYPNATVYNDITKFPANKAKIPDVLWLSPPCQDISIAGNRAGLDGSRSRLFFDAVDSIRIFYNRGWRGIAVMEQVPRLLTSHGGRDFARVLAALQECGASDIAWRVLDSRYFGVPQRRQRVYIVADFGGERAGQILFEPESLRGDAAPRREAGKEDPGTVAYCLGCRSYADRGSDNNLVVGTLTSHHNRGCSTQPDQLVVGTITASMSNGNNGQDYDKLIFEQNQRDEIRFSETAGLRAHPGVKNQSFVFDNHPQDQRITEMGEVANTVKARYGTGGGNTPIVLERVMSVSNDQVPNTSVEIAPTLRAMNNKDSHSNGGGQFSVLVNRHVRRLTPTECLRLQGMPDDWCNVNGKPISDSAIYRMAGNAVTATVAEWIARRIMEVCS